MKKLTLLLAFWAICFAALQAQSSNRISFNYQGVLRDTNNQPYKNREIKITATIGKQSGNTDLYTETHNQVVTNSMGVFNIKIGEGQSGDDLGALTEWADPEPLFLYIDIEFPADGAYRSLTPTQLLFVPYAIHAIQAEKATSLVGLSAGPGISVQGNTISNTGVLSLPSVGGDLSGSIGALNIEPNKVTSTEIVNNSIYSEDIFDGGVGSIDIRDSSIQSVDIAENTINSADIQDGGIIGSDINQMGAAIGGELIWNGSTWTPTSKVLIGDDINFNANRFNFLTGGVYIGGFGNQQYFTGSPNIPPHSLLQKGDLDHIVQFDVCAGSPDSGYCGRRFPYDALEYWKALDALAIPREISLWADKNIIAEGFLAKSDFRIKKRIEYISPFSSLATISRLRVANYDFKDNISTLPPSSKGFIAQEVEQVFPEAVTQTTNFIPDIYQLSRMVSYDPLAGTLSIQVDSLSSLHTGDMVRIITGQAQHELVVNSVNGTTFTVNHWPDKAVNEVFVYGKQVHDFRVVDYDRIFTLNVSATQALMEEVDDLKAQVAELQSQNSTLMIQNTALQQEFQQIEQKIQALATRLDGQKAVSHQPALTGEK